MASLAETSPDTARIAFLALDNFSRRDDLETDILGNIHYSFPGVEGTYLVSVRKIEPKIGSSFADLEVKLRPTPSGSDSHESTRPFISMSVQIEKGNITGLRNNQFSLTYEAGDNNCTLIYQTDPDFPDEAKISQAIIFDKVEGKFHLITEKEKLPRDHTFPKRINWLETVVNFTSGDMNKSDMIEQDINTYLAPIKRIVPAEITV